MHEAADSLLPSRLSKTVCANSKKSWGERRGLNPRPSVPQTDALPAELRSPPPKYDQFRLHSSASKEGVPDLRRSASCYAVYPALPRWAKVFRASGAALRHTGYRLRVANHKSQAATRGSRINRAKARAPEARKSVAQPVRAGTRGNRNSEHRRCDTRVCLGDDAGQGVKISSLRLDFAFVYWPRRVE
jgi:hypothetical protein